ncbi:MAG: glycosyl transferase family protein [Celeribacter sp.]|jgi:anthranilate phosphoribosyltransferase
MSALLPYVQLLGRGPGRSRNLDEAEARAAMDIILRGDADPEALGALLMLMRFRGESAAEVAGFTHGFRDLLDDWRDLGAGLDWPSYAAGRSRGAAWFLLAAKLVAQAGVPVLLHGWNSHQSGKASVTAGVAKLGIATVTGPADATRALRDAAIAYAPLDTMCPRALDLLKLRDVLGLRSCVNTCMRMLNPGQAPATVQGVFHPPYRELQADAGALLGQPHMTVLKGAGGEFERMPTKPVALFGLRNGAGWEDSVPALLDDARRLSADDFGPDALPALWSGALHDPFAETVVLGTAAVALMTLGRAPDHDGAMDLARTLWAERPRAVVAA